MKPRNIKNTIAKGEELQQKNLVAFYLDEIKEIRNVAREQAKENSKTRNEFFANYEYYLIENALNFGAVVGFNAGTRQAKKK